MLLIIGNKPNKNRICHFKKNSDKETKTNPCCCYISSCYETINFTERGWGGSFCPQEGHFTTF